MRRMKKQKGVKKIFWKKKKKKKKPNVGMQDL